MEETGTIRNELGQFVQGVSGNPEGRKPDTPEQKIIKKATKQIIAEYREALSEALPLIQPVLIAKALEGDISSIKEIHDRTMDKAKQPTDITSNGETLKVEFANIFNKDEQGLNTSK